jgi:hypothetical protein
VIPAVAIEKTITACASDKAAISPSQTKYLEGQGRQSVLLYYGAVHYGPDKSIRAARREEMPSEDDLSNELTGIVVNAEVQFHCEIALIRGVGIRRHRSQTAINYLSCGRDDQIASANSRC